MTERMVCQPMAMQIDLTLNGSPVQLDIQPEQTLLSALRGGLQCTGPKMGCGIGECGACTVLLNGVPVKSCVTLAAQCSGATVITIEGLAQNDRLHPLQQAFIDCNAVQCGFCTAGFIMTALGYLSENPTPTRDEIQKAISGNLCRCTGYVQIIDAIEAYANRTPE